MSDSDQLRIDRDALSIVSLEEQDRLDREYWRSKTPRERCEALETIRQILYDYDPSTARLQRVLEITRRT